MMRKELRDARRALIGRLLSSGGPARWSKDKKHLLSDLPALDGDKRIELNIRLSQAEELDIPSLFIDTSVLRYLLDVEQAARELLKELDK